MPKSFEITLRQNSEPSTRLERITMHAYTRHHTHAAVLPCIGGTSAVARRGWEAPIEPTCTCAPPMRPVSRSSRWTPQIAVRMTSRDGVGLPSRSASTRRARAYAGPWFKLRVRIVRLTWSLLAGGVVALVAHVPAPALQSVTSEGGKQRRAGAQSRSAADSTLAGVCGWAHMLVCAACMQARASAHQER